MQLVDTNILAFVVIDGPQTTAARDLLQHDSDWRTEAFALIELSNVMATMMRVRGLALADAQTAHATARMLIEPGLIAADHADVLAMAERRGVSAYDARFLVASKLLGVRLVTEDVKLRKAASDLCQSLEEALAACE